MTGRHRGGQARQWHLAAWLLAAVGWGYTGRHRLAPTHPRWAVPPGMHAPAAPDVAPVHAGPALPTSRQSLAPRLTVVSVSHGTDLAVASVLSNTILADVQLSRAERLPLIDRVAPERADDAVYARLDAERMSAATVELAQSGQAAAPQTGPQASQTRRSA